ncbi:MAG: thioredoxin family protein [Candidatus Aegiribacteria sp.]
MKIQVLGMGCPKCKKLYKAVEKAIEELGLEDVQLEKVEKLSEISAMGVMMTPALAIDGEVPVSGRVPSVEEIKGLIQGR